MFHVVHGKTFTANSLKNQDHFCRFGANDMEQHWPFSSYQILFKGTMRILSLIATRSYGRQNDVKSLVVHVHVYNFQRGIRQPNSISTLKPPGGYFITNAIGIGYERPSWTVFHNLGQSIKVTQHAA